MRQMTLSQGHVPGRARLVAACRPGHVSAAWRPTSALPTFLGSRTTTVAVGGNRYEGIADPAGALGDMFATPTTKRPARHLAPRTT